MSLQFFTLGLFKFDDYLILFPDLIEYDKNLLIIVWLVGSSRVLKIWLIFVGNIFPSSLLSDCVWEKKENFSLCLFINLILSATSEYHVLPESWIWQKRPLLFSIFFVIYCVSFMTFYYDLGIANLRVEKWILFFLGRRIYFCFWGIFRFKILEDILFIRPYKGVT